MANPTQNGFDLRKYEVSTPPLNPLYSIPVAPVSLLVPGTGHYLRGEKEIAFRLFRSGVGSIAVLLLSSAVLRASGAADAVVLPMVPLALYSGTSWLSLSIADITGMTLNQTEELNYKHRFVSDWSAYMRYRRIDDYYFDTTGYYQFGSELWLNNKVVSASVETNPDVNIRAYKIDFGIKFAYNNKDRPRDGIYLHGALALDDNEPGYYRLFSITYGLKSILNLSAFGSHLHQLIAKHEIGLQQHFVTYQSPNFDGIDSSTGLTGGFELSWTATKYFKPSLGYIHQRDTSLSASMKGFTGDIYGSLEVNIWRDFFVIARGYLRNGQVFDVTFERRL